MKQNVTYQVVFFCHLFHDLQKKRKRTVTLTCSPPSPLSLPLPPPSLPPPHPPPPAHEVHWQCTTHNEGSLHASMKFNLRCEWMTEKSCRLWFILMKLHFKTAPHGRACWAATEFLITYKLRVFGFFFSTENENVRCAPAKDNDLDQLIVIPEHNCHC